MSTELTEAEREALAAPFWQGYIPAEAVAAVEHILAARLTAQREQIAEAIEALHPLDDCPSCNYGHGLRDAARIARGDA